MVAAQRGETIEEKVVETPEVEVTTNTVEVPKVEATTQIVEAPEKTEAEVIQEEVAVEFRKTEETAAEMATVDIDTLAVASE